MKAKTVGTLWIMAMVAPRIVLAADSFRPHHGRWGLASIFWFWPGVSEQILNQTEGGEELVLDDYSGGFKYIRNGFIEAGASPPIHFSAPAGIGVGLDLIKGRLTTSERFVKDRESIKKLPKIRVPDDSRDLSGWSVGDNVTYEAYGGIGFSGGIDYFGVGVDAYFYAEGDWAIFVKKTGPNAAYVKITKTRLRSLGVAGDAEGLAAIGIEKFRSRDKDFSFSYDLSSQQGRLAYEDALKGNLAPSDRMARENPRGPVRCEAATENDGMGWERYWYYYIVLAGADAHQGKTYGTSTERRLKDGSLQHVEYGMWVNESETGGYLSSNKNTTNDFWAEYVTTTDRDGKVTRSYDGQFSWNIEKNKTSAKDFRKEVGQLVSETGLSKELALEIPDGKYGYLDVMFEANLDQDTVDALMDYASGLRAESMKTELAGTAFELLNRDLARPETLAQACGDGLIDCREKVSKETLQAIDRMMKELQAMSEARNRGGEAGEKSFVHHFAEFGHQMLKNRYTFGAVIKASREAPMSMNFSIEGERVSKFYKEISPSGLF